MMLPPSAQEELKERGGGGGQCAKVILRYVVCRSEVLRINVDHPGIFNGH